MRVFFFVSIVLVLVAEGCLSPSTITTANITQPVLVGKVKSIGGELVDKKQMYHGKNFSVSITNDKLIFAAIFMFGWGSQTEGSNKFDKQLLPIIDSTPKDSTAMIMIDSIRFSVFGGYWVFVLSTGNYGWLYGAKYFETNPEPDNIIIPASVEVLYNSTDTILNGLVRIKCTKKRESPFFSTISLSFDGVIGVDNNRDGPYKAISLKVEKDDTFFIRTYSLLLRVEVVQETDHGLILAIQKQ